MGMGQIILTIDLCCGDKDRIFISGCHNPAQSILILNNCIEYRLTEASRSDGDLSDTGHAWCVDNVNARFSVHLPRAFACTLKKGNIFYHTTARASRSQVSPPCCFLWLTTVCVCRRSSGRFNRKVVTSWTCRRNDHDWLVPLKLTTVCV